MKFEDDISQCLRVLKKGGTILYPTDTVWGIGCDALNNEAVKKIFEIKKRKENKSMIILIADKKDIMKYVAAPDLAIFDFIENRSEPSTIIFENAVGLADNLTSEDGSIAIRLVKDDFCRHLIKRFQKPIVSSSANVSGEPFPENFSQISKAIKDEVDYIVHWKQNDTALAQPSKIIKWHSSGSFEIIRP
jgi:L-threonylcarbamoyladenylate synthase